MAVGFKMNGQRFCPVRNFNAKKSQRMNWLSHSDVHTVQGDIGVATT
jgi:hypothetical protein